MLNSKIIETLKEDLANLENDWDNATLTGAQFIERLEEYEEKVRKLTEERRRNYQEFYRQRVEEAEAEIIETERGYEYNNEGSDTDLKERYVAVIEHKTIPHISEEIVFYTNRRPAEMLEKIMYQVPQLKDFAWVEWY
jgi:uncharacterized protein YaiL (DUF2058 family)